MRQYLVDKREPRAQTSSLLAATVYLDVNEAQIGQRDGIVANVGIANNDSLVLALLNPFESLQFLLVNAAGFPLKLPAKAPNLLRNKKAWTFDSAFPVLEYSRNKQALDLEELHHEILRLDGQDTLEVRFEIDRVSQNGKEVPLTAGTYSIGCIATLINADDLTESRVLGSPMIRVQFGH